jgi:LacI family transcriptional regulator
MSGDSARSEITIKDIARRAEVSYATVSRALNDKPGVRESTRRRVIALAEELAYTPNAIARGLVKRQTHTLGLIIPDITNPFYPEVARGIEDAAAEAGYSIFLCNTNWERRREQQYLSLLAEKRVDGVIIAPIDRQAAGVESAVPRAVPVVYVASAPQDTQASFVIIDNVRGGLLATEHLIEAGYTTVGFIGSPEDSNTMDARLEGYRRAMQAHGLPVLDRYIQLGSFRQQTGYDIIRRLILAGDRPRAVFAENDLLALGVVQGIKECGLKVPADVAVVGFDDIPFAGFPEVQLSTVAQPKYEMGRKAVEVLLERLAAPEAPPRRILLEPQLVVRRSSVS